MMAITSRYFFNHFNQLIISLLVSASALAAPATNPVEAYQPNGLIPVCVSAHYYACGLWDRAGQWRVEPRYHEIYENGSMWTVELDSGRVGLLDAEGDVLIEPTFGAIGPFNEGLAYAQRVGGRDERYGFIDFHGHWVIEPTFMYSASFKDGLALVWIPGEKPGRDFEDRYMALVDKTGKIRKLPFAEAVSQDALDGRFVVYRQVQYGNGEPSDMGVADKTGRLIVPWVHAQSIALIPHGGWMVQDAAPSKATVVYARNGREVFRVSGEEAHIYYFEPQSIAVFTQDGQHEGLVNLATGKVLIRPKDVDLGEVSNGLVSFRYNSKGDKAEKWGYMDLTGHVVMPPSLAYGPAFESEVVTSCHSEGKKVCDVVNHDLRRVDAFDQYQASSIWPYAWETGPQSPALRNVLMLYSEPKGNQGSTAKLLTDPKGTLILRIAQEGECDAEVAYTPDHRAVWPHHPEMTCLARNMISDRPAKDASPALIAAYNEIQAFEREKTIERAKLVNAGGGIENLLGDHGESRKRFQNLPWVLGPTEITLANGEATLNLPAGYRYISAHARRAALPQKTPTDISGTATDGATDDNKIEMDLIAGPDFSWVLEVVAVQRGYVDLSMGLSSAEKLLETRKVYQRGNPLKQRSTDDMMADLMSKWVQEPELDLKRQRLSYAYGYGSPEYNLTRFGRQTVIGFMSQWTSMYSRNDFDTYGEQILNLVDAVEFKPGHAYADYQAGDKRAPFGFLETLVTGLPSKGFTEFSQAVNQSIKRDEEKKQAKVNGLLIKLGFVIFMLIVLLVSWLNGRKEKNQTV